MKSSQSSLVLAVALAVCAGHAAAAERPKVDVECQPTAEKLVYACNFVVKGRKSGKAIDAADFKVSADMASMPMAHNVKPIVPEASTAPGAYHGKLHLEMTGEWTLKMEFRKPVRDIVIKKLMFGAAKHDHSKMDHSKHSAHGHGAAKETKGN